MTWGFILRLQFFSIATIASTICLCQSADAQTPLTEANRAIQQPDVVAKPEITSRKKVEIENRANEHVAVPRTADSGIFIGAINVEGAHDIAGVAFSSAIEPLVGKN
jgi:hypothetical protein